MQDSGSNPSPTGQVAFFRYSDMLYIFGYSEAIQIAGPTYHPDSSRLISPLGAGPVNPFAKLAGKVKKE